MHLPLNQRGASQIILPLFLVAGIALAVYLSQQPTELTPSADEVPTTAPNGCEKITPVKRLVKYKNCLSTSIACGPETNLLPSTGEKDSDENYVFDGKKVATYPLKEVVWEFTKGWKLSGTKGPRQPSDGDRIDISKGRFDSPTAGKSYHESNDAEKEGYTRITYGDGVVVEYVYTTAGTNYQGLQGNKYDPSRSYAFAPSDPNSSTKCDGTGSKSGNGKPDSACTSPSDCASGVCTNKKCTAQGNKAGGANCDNGPECQSGSCSNGKCEGGTKAVGGACDENKDCASNKCSADKKCVGAAASSATPKASAAGGSNNNGGGTASTAPSTCASPISSVATGSPTPVYLTKAEITGFRNSYAALATRLGPVASSAGNLKIVSGIAGSELESIVSQLPTCPDDANVGTCLDTKFRTRFDLAKTAARLSAFYGIFNGVAGICVKADLGLNPLITATSQSGVTGRVNLCTDRLVATRIWMIFANKAFTPILSTDARFPANPSCQTIPADVLAHYRNAETLFSTQAGFIQNTLCDGKTSVAPGGGT